MKKMKPGDPIDESRPMAWLGALTETGLKTVVVELDEREPTCSTEAVVMTDGIAAAIDMWPDAIQIWVSVLGDRHSDMLTLARIDGRWDFLDLRAEPKQA